MKKIKWMFLVMIIACKQDPELTLTNNYVRAGIVSENMVYHDFEPDLTIDTLPIFGTSYAEVNKLDVDLNNNGLIDFTLRSLSRKDDFNYSLQTDIIPSKTQTNQISINAAFIVYVYNDPFKLSYACTGIVRKLKYKDNVGIPSDIWTPLDSIYNGYPLRVSSFGLAYRNLLNEDSYISFGYNNWRNTNNGYMGIRFLQGNDMLYGWVRMSVLDYSKIVIHDCAYQIK